MKQKVLFLCTHNSVRSQMAEAILKHLAPDKLEVKSAGTKPCGINPNVKKVLDEVGIDTSGQYSKNVSEFINEKFDYIITVCDGAKQVCPIFPGEQEKLHWPLEDPGNVQGTEEEMLSAFRKTRDILLDLCRKFTITNLTITSS